MAPRASTDPEEIKRRLLRRIGKEFVRLARQEIESDSVAKSLFARILPGRATVSISTPYYWAKFYHDGRGPVMPVEKKVLVWFRNPRDDPRNRGGYPKRKRDARRLTADEFYKGLLVNKLTGSRDNPMPYMVIANRAGPYEGDPFFKRAQAKFLPLLERIVQDELKNTVLGLFAQVDFPKQGGRGGAGARATFTIG